MLGWYGPITHRQYLAWQEWLKEEQNRPSRSDHYVMQVAREVTLPYLRDGVQPRDLKEYAIKFGPQQDIADPSSSQEELAKTDGPPIMTDELILEAQKQMAIAKMGGGVKYDHRWVNKQGEPIPSPCPKQA